MFHTLTRGLLFLPLSSLFAQAFLCPTGTSHLTSRDESTDTMCVDGCAKRTLFSIIWTCILTTIICVWTTVHPNIPPQESWLKGTLRQIRLMLCAIIAPEILPSWALKQMVAAWAVKDLYNNREGMFFCFSKYEEVLKYGSEYMQDDDRAGSVIAKLTRISWWIFSWIKRLYMELRDVRGQGGKFPSLSTSKPM